LWTTLPFLSITLGLTIFFAISASVTVSVLLPWLFYRANYDPAVASGPLSTVISEIVSLLIYFYIASTLLL
jgi:magnesium transporter